MPVYTYSGKSREDGIVNKNTLNDGTRSGTVANVAHLLRFLAAASEDPELCDPGLHLMIVLASQTVRDLDKLAIKAAAPAID